MNRSSIWRLVSALVTVLILSDELSAASQRTIRIDGFPDYDSHFKVVIPSFMNANPDLDVKYLINNHDDHHKKLTNNFATGSGAGDVVLVDVPEMGYLSTGESHFCSLLVSIHCLHHY